MGGLPVVENATNLASPTWPRPTRCTPVEKATNYGKDFKRCNRDGRDSESDRCSCGIKWGNIPGPTCSQIENYGKFYESRSYWKPTPYWGTGHNGCYCWCYNRDF